MATNQSEGRVYGEYAEIPRQRGPQGERGPLGGAAFGQFISAPQRALKESISGDETKWGVDRPISRPSVLGISPGNVAGGFEPEQVSVSAQENALDWGIDPIDLITGGLGKATNMLRKSAGITPNSFKGRQTASFSNYVDNYYGLSKEFPDMTDAERESLNNIIGVFKGELPEDVRKIPGVAPILNKVAERAAPKVEQFESLSPREQQIAFEKIKGLGTTLWEGAGRATKDFFNPADRAMWAQHGVNKATQDIIQKHVDGQGNRWEGKAIAQGQYLNHILRQSGREGNIHPAVQAIADASNLQQYSENTDDLVEGWLKTYEAEEVLPDGTSVAKTLSDADAAYAARHMNEATGNPDLMVMKRPEQAQTGKHKFDVLGDKNRGFREIQKAFTNTLRKNNGRIDNEMLGKELSKVDGIRVTPAEGGGYWVTNGTNASAITEGGINSLIKVQPDGQVIGFMSDRHDWLEKGMGQVSKVLNKIPGANFDVENAILENSLAAISPPMYRNLYEVQKVQDALYDVGAAPTGYNKKAKPRRATKTKGQYTPLKPQYQAGPNKVKPTGNIIAPFDKEYGPRMLQDILDIKPSSGAVASEYLARGTGMFGAAGAANRLISDGGNE